MAYDLGLVALVLGFGAFGYHSGAIRQLTYYAGLACGALLSGPAATRLTPVVAPRLGWPAAAVRVGLAAVLFSVLAGLGAYVVHAVLSKMAGGREDGPVNRSVGFTMGAVKGTALLFAAASVALFFEGPLTDHFGPAPKGLDQSAAVGFVRRHNLFEVVHTTAAAKLEKLLAAAGDPAAAKSLAQEPELKQLLDDPQMKSALQDENVARAIRSGDLSALKNDPKLAALLKDPRLAGLAR